jgi:hypothetical protein
LKSVDEKFHFITFLSQHDPATVKNLVDLLYQGQIEVDSVVLGGFMNLINELKIEVIVATAIKVQEERSLVEVEIISSSSESDSRKSGPQVLTEEPKLIPSNDVESRVASEGPSKQTEKNHEKVALRFNDVTSKKISSKERRVVVSSPDQFQVQRKRRQSTFQPNIGSVMSALEKNSSAASVGRPSKQTEKKNEKAALQFNAVTSKKISVKKRCVEDVISPDQFQAQKKRRQSTYQPKIGRVMSAYNLRTHSSEIDFMGSILEAVEAFATNTTDMPNTLEELKEIMGM